jgi:hypothetical protein
MATTDEIPAVGEVREVVYPFIRATYGYMDVEGPVETEGWKPGHRYEDANGEGDVEAIADARGLMRLTVLSVHKPGKYQARVFCTRRFVTPDGHEFGKGKLHIMTLRKFERLSRAYQVPYRLPGEPTLESARAKAEAEFYRAMSEQTA